MSLTLKQVREIIDFTAGSVAKNKEGNFVARKGYFYRMGSTAEKFAETIRSRFAAKGINIEIVNSGDHWAPFRGGASLARSSHFYVEFK